MKFFLLNIVLFTNSISLYAQTNLQTHYNLGHNRKYITSVVEMFKTDDWGSTYFFVDYEYDAGDNSQPSYSYFEISRALKFWNGPVSAHIEYNGGVGNADNYGFSISNAYLAGANYDIHNADFSKTFSIELMYKYIEGDSDEINGVKTTGQNSFQVTAVWNMDFLNGKFSLNGYADTWIEDNIYADNAIVFITEPQIWFNFNKHLSAGSDIVISSRLCSDDLEVNPTLALKWNF